MWTMLPEAQLARSGKRTALQSWFGASTVFPIKNYFEAHNS